jgi:hypothetical protein
MFDSSIFTKFIGTWISKFFMLLMIGVLASCMPEPTAPQLNKNNTLGNNSPTINQPAAVYSEPSYPLAGIFIQEGAIQTSGGINIPVNFNDSFLVRGGPLSRYLRTIPLSTNFCLVANYLSEVGSQRFNRFLVLSAKPKFYTDLVRRTTEYYLQVEPANDVANQSDCLTPNFTNALFANAENPSLSFSLNQLCANCTTAITSSPLRLFFMNGEQVPNISLGVNSITISGSTTTAVNSCLESSSCMSRGFDCCLNGQCVKDGALKAGANLLPGFPEAQEDVRLNPSRFVVYPQFYFVCESRPDSTTGGSIGSDPDYEANIRLLELQHLYECLNKVDGEFSYCTIKFTDASKRLNRNFSPSDAGFNDDINFTTLNTNYANTEYVNNIVKVIYGGQILYEHKKVTPLAGATFIAGTANDNISTSQGINLPATLPDNARDDHLYLSYKIDGTCERSGATLARCSKTYIQGSSDTLNTTWHDSTKTYLLPSYADASETSSIIVRVSGIIVPEDTNTWSKHQNPNRVVFNSNYPIYQNQTIEISYFVIANVDSLMKTKTAAQGQVNTICNCGSLKCNLRPVLNSSNAITNYECVYPTQLTNDPPANQTVYVSNKNMPHRYYDTNGVNYDEDHSSAPDQELAAFTYTNGDVLKPNNLTSYIGFNEILGSFAKTGTYIARPAKMIRVKKDKQYDIIVNSGVFSSCLTCGADYYSNLQRIFPQNFGGQGGGYRPDYFQSSRETNTGTYRSDDLLYGRACFVPPTMIPWTHMVASTPRDQRRMRLQAQHFLFANGYQRDWYGFDYGSVIGSFDGVTWFSIGNQRRIKATSGRMYLAVNAWFGDLNVDNNYNILVSETSTFSSAIPDHDTKTDGAECQRAHFCSTDNDCIRNLGYDYTCQNVSALTTNWPQFDTNATEIVGSSIRSISSIIGGMNGQSKRCVYRGRGAPCLANLSNAGGTTFNGLSVVGTLSCSSNNSCAPLTLSRFNDRIARFANTPLSQNLSLITPSTDTVALGARIIGRPFSFYGSSAPPSGVTTPLSQNQVGALCIPGKDIANSTNTYELNSRVPSTTTDSSDKNWGVGTTLAGSSSAKYLNACPATDAGGVLIQTYSTSQNLGTTGTNLQTFSITQNMSSNLLDLTNLSSQVFNSSLTSPLVTSIGYQRNACLRAPGASCFSDMECAPSNFIANKVRNTTLNLNDPEKKFWEEDLVCGNPDFKLVNSGLKNPNFDIKKNKCCREYGKTLTVFTQFANSNYHWCNPVASTTAASNQVRVAGVNTAINNTNRYSRVHTGYDRMTCNRDLAPSTPYALSLVANSPNDLWKQIRQQYKTLDTINSRTCCTGHWVRSFATDNGGGFQFTKNKMQTIDKGMFKHISWFGQNNSVPTTGGMVPFECHEDQFSFSNCEIKSFSAADEELYLSWAGSLELLGIPQVAVKATDQVFKTVNDSQNDITANKDPLDNSVHKLGATGSAGATVAADILDSTGKQYYSAATYNSFKLGTNQLKKVFSESEFNCCIPTGEEVPDTVTSNQCCTGLMTSDNGPRRCCLPDFTNVTVYLNRYVSSQGRGLPDSAYDELTGYIKDPGQVQLIAAQKSICCSGTTMTGVAISNLSIPITSNRYLPPNAANTSKRFVYRDDAVDNNEETGNIGRLFEDGLRWNNHVYCVPEGYGQ